MKIIGNQLATEGFDSSAKWLANAQLTPDELGELAPRIMRQSNVNDIDHWIHWMSNKIPADQLAKETPQMIARWTDFDTAAAEQWIKSTPPGPVRNAAIISFTETIAHHQPKNAAAWSLMIPESEDRTYLQEMIYHRWKFQDETAATKFANEHGLSEWAESDLKIQNQ